jgi:hypothetical protein
MTIRTKIFLILFIILAFSPTCSIRRNSSLPEAKKTSLIIEEYALESLTCEADPEARCFVPASSTFNEVMAVRASERAKPPESTYTIHEGSISALFKNKQLTASLASVDIGDKTNLNVKVDYDGETVFTRSLGPPSPINPLQGLWVHDGHWYLEVADNNSGGNSPQVYGVVVIDGEALHEKLGYDETFGFAILEEMPFYFFSKSGIIDISFDNEVVPVGYEHIPHNACCSGARLNPIRAANMISFFAQRDGVWYYVEAGVYP